uniref:QueT transporter family protein n=1 Tax=Thermofilum pendens TaxID=2269 RepID=A0A7C4FEP1_THEPE
MKPRDLALSAVLAAMYAAAVVLLSPVSFLVWQVRIADALLMLSTVLGWPAVVGVTVGCFVGNMLAAPWGSAFLNAVDAVLGSLANLAASYLGLRVGLGRGLRWKAVAAAVEVAVVSLVVGSYLKYLLLWAFGTDIPLWLSVAGVLPGSVVSIGVLGTGLAVLVERRLQSLGLGERS